MNVDTIHIVPLNMARVVLHDDWNYTDVCSPFARIYYIVSGNAAVEMQGKSYPLHPKHLFLIPPFVKHTTMCKGTFDVYYFHVYEDKTSGVGMFDEYDFPAELPAQNGDLRLCKRLLELNPMMDLPCNDPKGYDNKQQLEQTIAQDKQYPDWVRVETRGIVMQLLSRFLAQAKLKPYTNDVRIVKAITHIHEHLGEAINLQQLADEAGLSLTYLSRLFAETTGMPPKLYISTKRIERAQHLLHTTALPVKDIALQVGYPDGSYFIRFFKQTVGLTPGDYRSQFTHEGKKK